MKRICMSLFLVMSLSSWIFVMHALSQPLTIKEGAKVKFDFTLRIDGQQIDTSIGKVPVEFVHGSGTVISGLSLGMIGLGIGNEKTIVVQPEDAYGALNPNYFKEVSRSQFPTDVAIKVGMVLEMKGPDGQTAPGIVWEVHADTIILNFNHPLAGKTLEFDVKIIEIE